MSRSYKATGINLKAIPLGETDRLLTILTAEQGLIRAVAPGARKHKSRLGGRSAQFVINDLLVIQGKRLDKVVQAETVRSFPGLAGDLGKLTASQYLAELVMAQALEGQPQADLFTLFVGHLERLEQAPNAGILAALCQGIFHLLALAGVAPEVQRCCITQRQIQPDLITPQWQVGFSAAVGGVIGAEHLNALTPPGRPLSGQQRSAPWNSQPPGLRTPPGRYAVKGSGSAPSSVAQARPSAQPTPVTAMELALLQRLSQRQLLTAQPLPGTERTDGAGSAPVGTQPWIRIERLLRQYAEYQLDRPIRSALLLEACFPDAIAPV
jgi:DNA repair protein RecO (recombination protein O)